MMKAFLVLVFLSLKLRSLETLQKSMDASFFGNAYKGSENVAYCEEGSALNVPCVPESTVMSSSLTKKPTITWVDPHTGAAIYSLRKSTLPGGELMVSNCNMEDSGVYQCNMNTEEDIQRVSYRHTIIVYTTPVYRKEVEFVYVARVCDENLIARLMKEVQSIVCEEQGDKCAFEILLLPCEKHRSEVYLKLHIIVHSASKFKAPKCGPKCVKDAFVHNLERDEIKNKLELLQKSSEDTFTDITGFTFDPTRMTEEFIPLCPDGHVTFQEIVCIPCMHGYYKSDSDNKTCKQCGIWAYQPRFGSTACIRCPKYGHSDYVTSPSLSLCKPFWKTWQGILAISLTVVILCVISFLILLHLGAFPCIYKIEKPKDAEAEAAEKKNEELDKLMQYYDQEPAEPKEGEGLLERTTAGTDNKRWYPGLGWM